MNIDIDWSKAPEGAEVHFPNQAGTAECFAVFREDGAYYAYPGMTEWTRWSGGSKDSLLSRFKHSHKEWNGEGLPPVGTVCEAKMPPGLSMEVALGWEWRTVEVVKSGMAGAENECLVFDVGTTRPAWVDEFRPIRTPEQIAEEELYDRILSVLRDDDQIRDPGRIARLVVEAVQAAP